MKRHLISALVFWSISITLMVATACYNSRLFIYPLWTPLLLLIISLLFYVSIGILLSFVSYLFEAIIYRFKSLKRFDFFPLLFGLIHFGIAIFISTAIYFNRILQPSIPWNSLKGLSSNLAIWLSASLFGMFAGWLLFRLKAKFWKWATIVLFITFIVGLAVMKLKVSNYGKPITTLKIPQDTGLKVFLFGLDGATWKVLDPLIEKGEAPHFAQLVECGFSAKLQTFFPTSSAPLWTSIATGKKAVKHNLHNVSYPLFPGNATLSLPEFLGAKKIAEFFRAWGFLKSTTVNSNLRKVKALWNINTDYGLSTQVVGWWGTWPPDEIKGSIVTNYTSSMRRAMRAQKHRKSSLNALDYFDSSPTYPPELYQSLFPISDTLSELTWEEANRFYPVDSVELAHLNQSENWEKGDYAPVIKLGYLNDEFFFKTAHYLMDNQQWEVFLLYLELVDIFEHHFWTYYDTTFNFSPLYGNRPFQNMITNAYKIMDEMLGEVMDNLDNNTVLIVVSDHGFESYIGEDGKPRCDHYLPFEGILIIAGPYIKHLKSRSGDCSVLDITPTILRLTGIPVGEDMDGRVIVEAIEDDFLHKYPGTIIPSQDGDYLWRKIPFNMSNPAEAEELEKFRSLGYIK